MLRFWSSWLRLFGLVLLLATSCGLGVEDQSRRSQTYGRVLTAETTAILTAETNAVPSAEITDRTTAAPTATGRRPDWLGTRTLPTRADGGVVPQTTPPALLDRRLPTIDTLPPPADPSTFVSTIEPLSNEVLARTTWEDGCPVEPGQLRYLTMSFRGFDGLVHTGEMVVNASAADDIVSVFSALFEAGYPIEEMRLVTPADLEAPPTGDGNNTSSFVCRPVTGGTRFSQHAFGLAVDVNPFMNPYRRGERTLPELATAYLDRDPTRPGLITEGDVVVAAFDRIGWHWGGRWSSLKDYQHFSLHNR